MEFEPEIVDPRYLEGLRETTQLFLSKPEFAGCTVKGLHVFFLPPNPGKSSPRSRVIVRLEEGGITASHKVALIYGSVDHFDLKARDMRAGKWGDFDKAETFMLEHEALRSVERHISNAVRSDGVLMEGLSECLEAEAPYWEIGMASAAPAVPAAPKNPYASPFAAAEPSKPKWEPEGW